MLEATRPTARAPTIAGLEAFKSVNAGIPGCHQQGRAFLESEFKGTALTGCSSEEGSAQAEWCGALEL